MNVERTRIDPMARNRNPIGTLPESTARQSRAKLELPHRRRSLQDGGVATLNGLSVDHREV